MQERTLSLVDGKFSVQIFEAGRGADLLFVHGAGGPIWDPFLDALAEHYHVVMPAHPGTGASTGFEHLLDHHDFLYWLLDVLDALAMDPVHVVGHSLGGWFAAELAAMQPQRLGKLVLIDPVGLWNDAYPVADFFAMLPTDLVEAVFHDPNHPAAKMMLEVPTDEGAVREAMITRAKNMSSAAKYLWPIPDKGLKQRIHRISAETLILWGKSDKLTPVQYADDFKRLIKNSRVEIFNRSGHMPQLEQPEETLAKVTAFLG